MMQVEKPKGKQGPRIVCPLPRGVPLSWVPAMLGSREEILRALLTLNFGHRVYHSCKINEDNGDTIELLNPPALIDLAPPSTGMRLSWG